MGKRTQNVVTLRDGTRGSVEAWHPDEGGEARALVRVEGTQAWVPASALVPDSDGGFRLPLERSHLAGAVQAVVPVLAEELSVDRRQVETGTVRVSKRVRERQEVVGPQTLAKETVEVERVPVNRYVEGPVAPRQEGDTLVVPVFEEVLVFEKRLVLKEELRITRRRTEETSAPQTVTLRTEEVVVERDGAGGAKTPPDHA